MRRGALRGLVLVGAGLGWAAVSSPARANSGGIPGYSGKTASMTCGACHSGGTQAPTVTITGPASLVTGAKGTYTVDVVSAASTAKVSGIDVASSASPPPSPASANEQVLSGEVVQTQPLAFSTGKSSWQFTWTAPAAAGSYTLFAGAVAANQDSASTGDSAATGSLAVAVTAPPDMTVPRDLTPPPPDLTPPPDLFGVDQAGLDLLVPDDLSTDDLAAPVDAISSASRDMTVAGGDGGATPADMAVDCRAMPDRCNEARWGCGCRVGAPRSLAARGAGAGDAEERGALASLLLGGALGGTLLVRRRRR